MIALDFQTDIRDAERYLKQLGPRAIQPAARMAINKSARAGLTTAKREVQRAITLPQKEFKDRLDYRPAKGDRLTAEVVVTKAGQKPMNLIRWVSKSKRQKGAFRKSKKGVSYKSPGSGARKRLGNRSFIAAPHGRPVVFVRKGEGRLPIVAKTGLSVKQGFTEDRSERAIRERAQAVFPREFDRQLKRRLARLG